MGPAVDVDLRVMDFADSAFVECTEQPLSSAEIGRFAQQLQQLRDWLLQSITQLEAQAARPVGGRTVSMDTDELAWQGAIHQRAMADKRLMLNEIMRAFERIKNNSYGRCAADESPIPRSLLEEVPWARYCAVCATRHS